MSNPLPWSFAALGWHSFRVPYSTYYVRRKGRPVRESNYPVDIEQWCKDNLQGRWTWGGSEGGRNRPYFIEDKQDAMLFKLVWSDRVAKPEFREIG